MENIRGLLKDKIVKKKSSNKVWVMAEEIAKITHTKPNRWLKLVKQEEWLMKRTLDELKDLSRVVEVKSPVAYFLWLYKKFKGEKCQ